MTAAMNNTIVAWIYSLITLVSPPERLAALPQWPGYEESAQQKQERYMDIARDLYAVVYDPSTPPLYQGPQGRATTAATILAIAWHESGFARDVDVGPCYRGKDNKGVRCDRGRSACLMQIQLGKDGLTTKAHGVEGLSQEDLFHDRKACFRAGLKLIRRSFSACAKEGPDGRLNAYASGTCGMGFDRSKEMFDIHRRMLRNHPIPVDDKLGLLAEPSEPPANGSVSLSDKLQ